MTDELRRQMVRQQLRNRGITNQRVLEAMERVPRERFVPENLRHLSYEDSPLPLPEDQTISQPFIVALMVELLELSPRDRVLEVGGGSGYAAAILGQVAGTIYSMERHADLARRARDVIAELEYENVCIITGDGTAGLPDLAPFDAILISAAGEKIPAALIDQLKPGGRIVSPVGQAARTQSLYRVRKRADSSLHYEKFGAVQFVPLIVPEDKITVSESAISKTEEKKASAREKSRGSIIKEAAEPLLSIDDFDFGRILERIGDARVVFMGEATHGTSEFYRFRAALSRELILRKNFSVIALEADWPDARVLDSFVRSRVNECSVRNPFSRFPAWMWRNKEMQSFLLWLKAYNRNLQPDAGVSVYGLDLYSMYSSIDAIVCYLEKVDPDAGADARRHYSCLTRWEDPATYGQYSLSSGYRECEAAVLRVLTDLLENRFEQETEDYFDTVQNARLVHNAEQYYRAIYRSSTESWNLRDRHMFGTLVNLLEHHGSNTRAIVWAHNSHLGNSAATEMKARGETNLGELGRDYFKDSLYSIGFGTNHGTVAAASYWDGPVEIKKLRPAHSNSYEAMFHLTGLPAFLLPMRFAHRDSVVEELTESRLQRAVGVIYRPQTELSSHYFKTVLPQQFDEYIWFDETTSLHPLAVQVADWPATTGTGHEISSDVV